MILINVTGWLKHLTHVFLACVCLRPMYAAVYSGGVVLPHGGDAFDKAVIALPFVDKLQITSHWCARRVFGREAIAAGFTVKNPTSQTMFFSYYVSFFDSGGKLVGSGSWLPINKNGLEAGKEEQSHSLFIYLPKERYRDITSYQVAIYESQSQDLN